MTTNAEFAAIAKKFILDFFLKIRLIAPPTSTYYGIYYSIITQNIIFVICPAEKQNVVTIKIVVHVFKNVQKSSKPFFSNKEKFVAILNQFVVKHQ